MYGAIHVELRHVVASLRSSFPETNHTIPVAFPIYIPVTVSRASYQSGVAVLSGYPLYLTAGENGGSISCIEKGYIKVDI